MSTEILTYVIFEIAKAYIHKYFIDIGLTKQ